MITPRAQRVSVKHKYPQNNQNPQDSWKFPENVLQFKMFKQLNIYKWLSEFPYAFAGGPDSTDSLDKESREGPTQKITLGLLYFVVVSNKTCKSFLFRGRYIIDILWVRDKASL